jgi:tetratricopeptide (TPR) repeat protein
VEWFQKAITADPNRVIAYLNLGDAYLQLGKKAEAKQAFEKYLELQQFEGGSGGNGEVEELGESVSGDWYVVKSGVPSGAEGRSYSAAKRRS